MPKSPRDTKRASVLELVRSAGFQFDTMTQAPIKRKVLRRFCEPLLLLSALGQIRGERIKSEINIDSLAGDEIQVYVLLAKNLLLLLAVVRRAERS